VIPAIDPPFPLRLNPHLENARAHSLAWAAGVGLVGPSAGGAGPAVWTPEKLADFDFAVAAAGIGPDSTPEELCLSADWLTWGTYADDYYPAVFGRRRDHGGARLQNERLKLFMPVADGAGFPEPANALERGLADLWRRITPPMTEQSRACLRHAVVEMAEGWVWELDNHALNKVPDPVDFMEMRRRLFGHEVTAALADIRRGDVVPGELAQHEAIASLENSATDYVCMINDVFSYQKEVEFEGEVHNLLVVVQNFFDCGYDEALGIVEDLMRLRLEQFQRAADVELPLAYEDYDLGSEQRAALDGRAAQLRDWIAGVLNWHRHTKRYREEDLLRHFRPAPPKAASVS